jgi:hypothetical protein
MKMHEGEQPLGDTPVGRRGIWITPGFFYFTCYVHVTLGALGGAVGMWMWEHLPR